MLNTMKVTVDFAIHALSGYRIREILILIARYTPDIVRLPLLRRIGVQNYGTIGRDVHFQNTAVRIERGAHIGSGTRFEGGAMITVAADVRIPPQTVITTSLPAFDHVGVRYDKPIVVLPGTAGLIISREVG